LLACIKNASFCRFNVNQNFSLFFVIKFSTATANVNAKKMPIIFYFL